MDAKKHNVQTTGPPALAALKKSSHSVLGSKTSINVSPSPRQGASLYGLIASRRLAKRFAARIYERRGTAAQNTSPRTGSRLVHPKQEPTYRTEPKKKFEASKVETIIKDVLHYRLEDYEYDPKLSSTKTKELSDEIKERVKKLRYERYKIVCLVTIGEKTGQGLQITSRCIWDSNWDTSSTYTYQNSTMFCTVTVFGVFNE